MKPVEMLESLVEKVKVEFTSQPFKVTVENAHAATLVATIIEMSSSSVVLLKNGHYSAVPIVCRNIFEALVDLMNLQSNDDYLNLMYFKQYEQQCRFHEVASPDNPMTKVLFEKLDFDAIKERGKNNRAKYQKLSEGIPAGIQKRFEGAGMKDYYAVYMRLCLRCHNNVSALEERHLDDGDSGRKITLFKQDPGEEYLYSDTIAGALLHAIGSFYPYVGAESDAVDEATEFLMEYRKKNAEEPYQIV